MKIINTGNKESVVSAWALCRPLLMYMHVSEKGKLSQMSICEIYNHVIKAKSCECALMLRRSHSSVPVFEIRLGANAGRDHNIVLLKGTADEAPPATLGGTIVLSTMDNVAVKRVVLRLYATLRLRWPDPHTIPKNPANTPVRYEKVLFEREFSDFHLPTQNVSSGRSNPGSRAASFTNLASYFSGGDHHSQSSTNLAASTEVVVPGSYQLPFEFVLPGNIPESIEGHDNAQLAYFLTASVERGRFQHNVTTKKHVRVVRTLGGDTYDWAHTVSIENTWPKKVEYRIFVPSKSVPVGGQLEVHFSLLPLDKGVKLGRIRTEIVEYSQVTTAAGLMHSDEKTVGQQVFPSTDIRTDTGSDGWVFTRLVNLPSSLSRCTQDASIVPFVKISHKFRVLISLINRDGHTSELRASLPIHLFISPSIYVSSQELQQNSSGVLRSSGSESAIFDVPRTNGQLSPQVQLESETTEAPPNYSDRVYDRLFSTVASPVDSPTGSTLPSGAQTPYIVGSPGSPVGRSLSNLNPTEQAQLQAGLRALAVSQEGPGSHSSSGIDIAALSRVPSYEHALHDDAAEDTAPKYE